MNILVIGNGFDLAHGLFTKYTDFLEWIKKYHQFYSYSTRKRTAGYQEVNEPILKYFNNLFYDKANNNICDGISHVIHNNIWIDYFLQNSIYQKENWIDFESEISRVIQSIDNDMRKNNATESTIIRNISEPFFEAAFLDDLTSIEQVRNSEECKLCEKMSANEQSEFMEKYREEHPVKSLKTEITYKELIIRLESDLNKLIRALEIYLSDYVEKIEISKISKDIKELDIDHVLSFNFTDTFEKLYDKNNNIVYDYIHGKADISNTIESNNMVLGIDEYLNNDRKNKDIEFIAFKKFYQRIHKQTGCKYKNWVDIIREQYSRRNNEINDLKSIIDRCEGNKKLGERKQRAKKLLNRIIKNPPRHNLYIFGHSLDVTDKDILRDLILNDNVYTTIYYLNKDVMGQQIANLVKVIGQDELIKRTGGITKTIEFKLQQDMVDIEDNTTKAI